ncbi:hypothetical protein KJZ99_08860 [bacterium]|nr:hypothetical protein [bacterium]
MSALDLVHRLLAPAWTQAKHIVLFEDEASEGQLFPLNVLRPCWEIRAGLGSLQGWMKVLRQSGHTVTLRPRGHMEAIASELAGFNDPWPSDSADVTFLNGRVLLMPPQQGSLPPSVYDSLGNVLWAKMAGAEIRDWQGFSGTEIADSLVKAVKGGVRSAELGVLSALYVWDYMAYNERLLTVGFGCADELLGSTVLETFPAGVHKIGDNPLYMGEESQVAPLVVFDTSLGSIWLGRGVEIEPHCYLKGPLSIGDHCRIKAGTVLYWGSSIGPQCRVSGEISGSILQGYVNKQHAGFLGNSHLGEWVNLGADTTVSNLRNDYGDVQVKLGQKLVDSGNRFVGLMCGDHTKTGINTMFNTGTVVGVAANVFGEGYPPRAIQSFSWGGKRGFKVEPLVRTLGTARIAMSRRGRDLSSTEEALLRRHYETVVNSGE